MGHVSTERKHRHTWKPATTVPGLTGNRYVWSVCGCGLRRVDTLGPGGVRVARRWEKGRGVG